MEALNRLASTPFRNFKMTGVVLGLSLFLTACTHTPKQSALTQGNQGLEALHSPLVIGHRGASGYRPEHTLEAYRLAIEMGADFIEPDLVMTKDGVLIARHENEISETTNVAQVFPTRKTKKTIDGQEVEGFFTEDFSLAEIKMLRANERLPFRDQSMNGIYEVPTLEEILAFVEQETSRLKRVIGVYPETKHPSYFQSIGLAMDDTLLVVLEAYGLSAKESPVFIQSFEQENLRQLRKKTEVRLIQLLDLDWKNRIGQSEVLKDIRSYADGIGPNKNLLFELGPEFILAAKAEGFAIHPWTHRKEAQFVNAKFSGSSTAELEWLLQNGVDGIFSDFPDEALLVRAKVLSRTLKDKVKDTETSSDK